MSWRIDTSKDVEKFLAKNKLTIESLTELLGRATRYFQGEDINVDIKKLKGKWTGFYRIRSGRIRIIAEFNFENPVIFIAAVDWRGNVY